MKLLLALLLSTSLFSQTKEIAFYANFPVDVDALTQIVKNQDMKVVRGNFDQFSSNWVFWNLDHKARKFVLKKGKKKNMVLFMWEPPTVLPKMYEKKYLKAFAKIYTWDDDLVDGKTYQKFYYPSLKPMIANIPSFEKKNLCTMVIGKHQSNHPHELYSLREKAIAFFETKPKGEFAFFGRGWDTSYSTYQGAIEDKIETMKHFRFAICFENIQGKKGYITEKIFDCFAAGVIPVYLGASNIEAYIPKSCFIDMRNYATFDALYLDLKEMSKEAYEQRLESIRVFLKSDQARPFSPEVFKQIFQESIR